MGKVKAGNGYENKKQEVMVRQSSRDVLGNEHDWVVECKCCKQYKLFQQLENSKTNPEKLEVCTGKH